MLDVSHHAEAKQVEREAARKKLETRQGVAALPTMEERQLGEEIVRVDESLSLSMNPWDDLSPQHEQPTTQDRPGGERHRQRGAALRASG